jgi:hypothetical protein
LATSLLPLGCSSSATGAGGRSEGEEHTGTLKLAVSSGADTHGVTQIAFVVVHPGQPCPTGFLVEAEIVPLQKETLPPFSPDGGSVLPEGGGGNHPFGDAFFVLNPGQFTVCAVPEDDAGNPVTTCQQATSDVTVFPGATTETLLVMQCTATENGGLDTVGILNTPPTITNLFITPSKFTHTFGCENDTVTLMAEATDPDGDALTFTWTLLDTGNSITGDTIRIRAGTTVQDAQILLTVTDVFGASTFLQFPIHISACPTDAMSPDPGPAVPTLSL